MGMVLFLVNAFIPTKGLIFSLDLACASERKYGQRGKGKMYVDPRPFLL